MRDLILVAGGQGIDGPVSKISVLDAPDGPRWLKGGEFILTSTFQFNNDSDRLCSFCEQLIDFGASGFGLKMGRYLTKVPQSLIDLCDRNNFPLLIIPYSFVWTDIISVFYELSYDLQHEEKYNTLKSKLASQIRASATQGPEWVGNRIYSFFDVPMLFLDHDWKQVTGCGSQKELTELLDVVPAFVRAASDLQGDKLYEGKHFAYNCCLLEQFGVRYIVFASDSPNIIGELREILIDAQIIEAPKKIVLASEDEMIGQALPTLLLGERIAPDLSEALEQCIEKSGGYYCMLYIKECATQQILTEIKESVKRMGFNTKCFAVYNLSTHRGLILLRFLKTSKHCLAPMQLRQIMYDVSNYLSDEEAKEKVFISNIYSSYQSMEQCCQEAKLTAQYSQYMWESRRLCYFEEIFPYYLMVNSEASPAYLDGIDRLENEGNNIAFDCMTTLEAYLRYGNFKQAAQELFIHENTLRYRIKKIGEMICTDFDDTATRQNYVIRVNLWKLKRGLRNLNRDI